MPIWERYLRQFWGKPLTIDQLKKKTPYFVNGWGKYMEKRPKSAAFVRKGNSGSVIAVILPVELPDTASCFYVVKHRDKLGEIDPELGDIVDIRSGQVFTFPWKEEEEEKQKPKS